MEKYRYKKKREKQKREPYYLVTGYHKAAMEEELRPLFASSLRCFQADSPEPSLLPDFQKCLSLIEKYHVYSKNETINDIVASDVPYLSVHYYIGKLHLGSTCNMKQRAFYIRNGLRHYEMYVNILKDLEILTNDEIDEVEETDFKDYTSISSGALLSSEEKRNLKIEKYKKTKQINEKISSLTQKIVCVDRETCDVQRELKDLEICKLQNHFMDVMNDLNVYKQELQLLQHMEELHELEDEFPPNNLDENAFGLPTLPPLPYRPGEGPGIQVTRTSKVGDEIIMTKEVIRANVFESRMAKPTMTLEEFADIEVANAIAREQAQLDAEQPIRRYNQLVADGDEDKEELVDQATEKDREWDDWKDNNPRGWGNKMNKRF